MEAWGTLGIDGGDDDPSAWTYLQLGHEGEDLLSMTKRWQFEHGNATIDDDDDESSQAVVIIISLWPPADMLSSKSSFCSSGLDHLFRPVFLFT